MSRVDREAYNHSAAARRYDKGRSLTPECRADWVERLRLWVGRDPSPSTIVDVGCGTGRFASVLADAFEAPSVVGLDRSVAMLREANASNPRGLWVHGCGQSLPLASLSVDLVWMSQAFHHFESATAALSEVARVLRPGGCFLVRNGTVETNATLLWIEHFAGVRQLEQERGWSRRRLTEVAAAHGFRLDALESVEQFQAKTWSAYVDRLEARAFSSLIAIGDTEFHAGIASLRRALPTLPDGEVWEPVDIFVFRKARVSAP